MRALNNSSIPGRFQAKAAELGSEEYGDKVARPVMGAVDDMPHAFRALVNEVGYIDVYRAWRRGWTPEMISKATVDGAFVFRG